MSELLWKSLTISPAVLGATLLVCASTVLAADGQAVTEVAQPQAVDVQTSKEQPLKDSTASHGDTPRSISASDSERPTDLVPQPPSVSATAATQAPLPTLAEAETVAKTTITPSPLALEPSNVEAPALVHETQAADATVAQVTPHVTPTAPGSTDVLNQINRYSTDGNRRSLSQGLTVDQLSDVSPNDWAFEALRELVERYGCIVGYPDRTYRGNRALTRYEFAAGLNACLNQIERLIAESTADFVTREDLETLQRLVQEFEAELATLGTRVDNLEGRVAFLEENQFSTTTKLSGEAVFNLTDEFNLDTTNNTVFQDRVRLVLNTSFSGQDRLVTRLTMGNVQPFNLTDDPFLGPTPLREGQQTISYGSTGNNSVVLDWLAYYFNFGSLRVYVAATGGIHSDYAPTLNPYFEDYDGGNGALSIFATENPIYRIGGGAGGAISLGTGPLESILGPSTLTVGYLAGAGSDVFGGGSLGPNSPEEKAGLFDGDYAVLGQLNFNIGDRIGIGATYVHGYHNTGTPIFDLGLGNNDNTGSFVGTSFANTPGFATGLPLLTPTVTNSYGIEAAFRLTDTISISGFGTYTNAILIEQGEADIWTYGAGVAFADLGKEGSVLGLFAGVEPTLRGLSANLRPAGGFARDNAYHFEAFYKYQLTDNISITPGVILLTAPEQNEDNTDAVIGTLRTTFTFKGCLFRADT